MSSRGVFNLKTKTIMAYAFRIKFYIIAVSAVGLFFMVANTASAATYTVTSTADSGASTFRQAIIDANANSGADEITFNIAGAGPHEIITAGYLPTITGETFVNGASQTGTVCGTASMQPQIIVKGYSPVVFESTAINSSLRGIAFPDKAVSNNHSMMVSASNFTVTCSMFGTQDGSTVGNSGRLRVLPNTTNVTVGGNADSDRNIFANIPKLADNEFSAPLLSDQNSSGTIENNYFGVGPDGETRLEPATGKVYGPMWFKVGTTWTLGNNIVVGGSDSYPGLIFSFGGMTLRGNYIGTDKTKTLDLGSAGPAINVQYGSRVLVGGVDPADKNFIYNYDIAIASLDGGIVSALGNEFNNNNVAIDKQTASLILAVNETGGNTEYTVQLGWGFDAGKDYRIELFSNTNSQNSKNGLDAENIIAAETISQTDYRQNFTIVAQGTGHTNPTATATLVDSNQASGFGQTHRVTGVYAAADMRVETTDGATAIDPYTANHEMTQTITNLGPTTVNHMDFNGLRSDCFTVNSITESGTATDTGIYDNLDWDGTLEQNQTLTLTFAGDITCTSGNIGFSHGDIEGFGANIFDPDFDNEDYDDDDTEIIGPATDLAITNILNNPEDIFIGGTLNYTLTLTNNGPNEIDLNAYSGGGQNPFQDSLFLDFIPFELNFVSGSSTNPSISCGLFPIDTNDPGATSILSSHPDHGIVQCTWTDGPQTLSAGQSVNTTISVAVDGSSDLNFATHAVSGWAQNDPDFSTMLDPFNSGTSQCSGYADLLDCYAGTGINNYAVNGPRSDLKLKQTLENSGDISAGDSVNYDMTITNKGPSALDLSTLDGSNNGLNSILSDVYPGTDLSFVNDDNPNVDCTDLGSGSIAYLGLAAQDHQTHQLISCYYTGNSQMLNPGASLTIRLSFTANAGVGNKFTSYAVTNGVASDPDTAQINNLFSTATGDILDIVSNENFTKTTYVGSSAVTDLSINKALVNTGKIAAGDTVDYEVTIANNGPADLDLATLNGSQNTNALFLDIYPGADLTYVDDNDPNVNCYDVGAGSIAYLGSAGQDHPDHQILSCTYTGVSQVLQSGNSLILRLSFTADAGVSTNFTNYVLQAGVSTDPDTAIIAGQLTNATQDILDTASSNNLSKASYSYALVDSDNDRISDGIEDAGPNNGDANNDGTLDSLQNNVTSFVNSTTNKRAVLAVSDDCSITTATVVAESANTEQDTTYIYPVGLMDFELDCGTPGYTADITQYYFDASDQDYIVRKYNTNNNSYSDIDSATITEETIDSKQVVKASYQITDGSSLDMDNNVDGNIKDPAGLAKVDSTETQNADNESIASRIVGDLANTGQSIALIATLAAILIVGGVILIRRNVAK